MSYEDQVMQIKVDNFASLIGINTSFNEGFASVMPSVGAEIGTFLGSPFTALNQMMTNAGGFLGTDETIGQVMGWTAVIMALIFIGSIGFIGGAGAFKLGGMII
jgi:hypothetical protein